MRKIIRRCKDIIDSLIKFIFLLEYKLLHVKFTSLFRNKFQKRDDVIVNYMDVKGWSFPMTGSCVTISKP
jgi:hypothetical protein